MKSFSPETIKSIYAAIDREAGKSKGLIAAFDADGTLWDTDLGEALFEYQIRNNLLPNLPKDPMEHYHRMKKEKSHEAAYLWLAQINAGRRIEEVREWAKAAVRALHPVPVFTEQRKIIGHLLNKGCQVYIVTASIAWAVEPGAALVGLKPENVIGIRTKVVDGLVTDQQDGSITYRNGKVTGLLEKTGGAYPFFCAGNTEGDLPLLEASRSIRVVVAASDKRNTNYDTEQSMIKLAQTHGWFCLQPT